MFAWSFWNDTLQRALRTFAQTLVALWAGTGVNLWHADWVDALGLAGGAALVSVLMSVDRSSTTSTPAAPTVDEAQ